MSTGYPPEYTFTTLSSSAPSASVDTIGPVISGATAKRVTQTTALITWVTDEPSSSQVSYGLTTAYGNMTPLDSALVTSHPVSLSNLTAGSAYYCKLTSVDQSGNKSETGTVNLPSEPSSCSETDNGQDYARKGLTTGWMPAAIGSGSNDDRYVTMTDYCRSVNADGSDPNWVQEYLCTSAGSTSQGRSPYITQASYYCPNGCVDGACR